MAEGIDASAVVDLTFATHEVAPKLARRGYEVIGEVPIEGHPARRLLLRRIREEDRGGGAS